MEEVGGIGSKIQLLQLFYSYIVLNDYVCYYWSSTSSDTSVHCLAPPLPRKNQVAYIISPLLLSLPLSNSHFKLLALVL